jgi:hypothetical protein
MPLGADGRILPVTAQDLHIVLEAQYLVADTGDQCSVVATWQI